MANEPTRWGVPVVTQPPVYEGPGFINVVDYGAVGDGTTDDTAAIQAAIDVCVADGGMVYFPPGVYLISDTLVVPDYTILSGCSTSSVIKLADDSDCHMVSIAAGISDVIIRDLKLDGNGANQTSPDGDGDMVNCVQMTSASHILIADVEVVDACDTGIHIGADPLVVYHSDITIRDSYVHGCGFQCVRARYSERIALTGNYFADWGTAQATSAAVVTTMDGEARNWRIAGNHFQNVAGTQFAIEVAGTGGVLDSVISGNIFDGNGLQGNGISGYFFRCTMSGNTHTNGYGNHRSGYEVVGTDNVISGNTIEEGEIVVTKATAPGTIESERNVVSGNTISTDLASAFGVAVNGTDILVTGNRVTLTRPDTYNQIGICLGRYGVSYPVVRCSVTGNIVVSTATNRHTGIDLWADAGSSDIFVTGNQVRGCYVGYSDEAGTNHTQVTVTDNDLRGNYISVSHGGTAGVYRIFNNVTHDTRPLFPDGDTTPDVSGSDVWCTDNSNPTTITGFDGGCIGKRILVEIADANTTFDFTGTTLKCGTSDWTPAAGDHLEAVFQGSNWFCMKSDNT